MAQGSKLIKNSVLILFNTFFMMMTSWIISIWVARQLGPTNYGIFNLVLWISGTMTWVLGMGLIHAVTKFIAEYNGRGENKNLRPIIYYVLKLEIVISLVTTVLLVFFSSRIADFFFSPDESFFFLLAAIGLLPGMITAIFSAAIEGIQKFEYFTYSNLILTPLSFASKIAVLMMGKGITGLLWVMLVFSFINAVFYYIVLKREGALEKGPGSLTSDIKKRILAYNNSVIAILVCDKIVWDKSQIFFLGRFCNAAEVGFYNLGFNVAQRFISILPTTFWRVLFPTMSSYFGSNDREKMKRLFFISTRYLAFFSFPVGIGGMILAYQIIHYLYGHDFIGAQRVLQIIFAASIFSSLSNPASAILYGFEKQAFIYRYGIVLAVINITLCLLFIKPYGAIGAAVSFGIITILASVGGLIYTCRLMNLKYPIVSVAKITMSTVFMGIVMELIILQNAEIPGFIISIVAGTVVYLTSALVLGTFEEEDLILLQSTKVVLPGKTKVVVEYICNLLMQFKGISTVSQENRQ
ncbi:MAG: flippase [Fibrobacter sp.]|nr:flippase [Fibrobacter sp.]